MKGKIGPSIALALAAACFIFGTSTARAGCRVPGNYLHGAMVKPSAFTGEMPRPVLGEPTIAGFWHVKLAMDSGDLLFQSTQEYHADGLEEESADRVPATGNFCMGVWKYAAHRTVQTYHIAWLYDSAGNLSGYAVIKEVNALSNHGNSFSGVFDFAQYDNDGNVAGDLKGTTTAQRIDFEHPFTIF